MTDVVIDRGQVLLSRRAGRMVTRIAVPTTAFSGVAARLVAGATEAEDRLVLLLVHRDRALDVTLFESASDHDFVSEWRRWGQELGLPLLIEAHDGRLVPAESPKATVGAPYPRHRAASTTQPGRVRAGRRTGHLSLVPYVHRDEAELFPSA